MNWKKIGVIIGREYAVRVKKKSFLVITFVTPVLMGLLMVLPTLIMLYGSSEEKGQNVAVIGCGQGISETKSGQPRIQGACDDIPFGYGAERCVGVFLFL